MAQEVFQNVEVRAVRDDDAGNYFLEANIDGVWRGFAVYKLGKLDQLRAEAKKAAADAAAAAPQPTTLPAT
jgi:hypothetical protein